MSKPKVYLAGKISKNDWRQQIVPQKNWSAPRRERFDDENGTDWNAGDIWEPARTPKHWAVREGDRYDITGPFFIGCDHGCTHGKSTHAFAGGCVQSHQGEMRGEARRLCLDAIDRSDYVFAWLDDKTAYGTIAEIGYAHAQRGVNVIIATPTCHTPGVHEWLDHGNYGDRQTCACPVHGDTWFVAGMAMDHIEATDPLAAWEQFLERYAQPDIAFDSPVEKQFWDAHRALSKPELTGLTPQHVVGRYRLDFAIPARKFAIEIDGLAYHNGQDSFMRDRSRQRHLEMDGWKITRFAAKEVMQDAHKCVEQAAQLATA